MTETVPLRQRKFDLLFLGLLRWSTRPSSPTSWIWSSWSSPTRATSATRSGRRRPLVDLVHWYGNHYDPLLMARPPFWRMTIWIDVIFFGPFYCARSTRSCAGRDWIRVPALVWSGTMLANVLIILMDERYGVTPRAQLRVGAAGQPALAADAVRDDRCGCAATSRSAEPSRAAGGMTPRVRRAVRTVGGGGRRLGGPGRGLRHRAGRAAGSTWSWSPAGAEPLAALAAPAAHPDGHRSWPTWPPPPAWTRWRGGRGRVEVGLVVANAAYSPIGPFLDLRPGADPAGARPQLSARRSSWRTGSCRPWPAAAGAGSSSCRRWPGMQGSPPISVYAATKAFGAVLAEGLWAELRGTGVDVVACVAGAGGDPRPRR